MFGCSCCCSWLCSCCLLLLCCCCAVVACVVVCVIVVCVVCVVVCLCCVGSLCGACCMLRCVRFCWCVAPACYHGTFQNVSLSTHLDLSSRLFTLTRGRGLTLTFARVLVRAHVDGPGSQPTDAVDHTSCVSRALLMPPLRPCNHRMCVIAKETGQSPQARTCSRTWTFLRRLHIWALRSLRLTPFKSQHHDPKNGDNFI